MGKLLRQIVMILLNIRDVSKEACLEGHNICRRGQIDKDEPLLRNVDVHREETICFLLEFIDWVKGRSLGLNWFTREIP
jgi:hypothetical protein